jgi:hypothetical protein
MVAWLPAIGMMRQSPGDQPKSAPEGGSHLSDGPIHRNPQAVKLAGFSEEQECLLNPHIWGTTILSKEKSFLISIILSNNTSFVDQ